MAILFSNLNNQINGELVQLYLDFAVKDLLTDSRNPILSSGSVFFALKGDRHDGHRYVAELYKKGLRQFVVSTVSSFDLNQLPEANICLVKDTLVALQAAARHHREQFNLPVIGITGSNGKTICKEWFCQLLGSDYVVVKSPKSYNSQIGVPLSVWQINSQHTLGIFEAGLSKPGEMEQLENIIQPTHGLFTNLGAAHDEGFVDREEKIKEKALLFTACQKIVYCKDQLHVADYLERNFDKDRLVSWSVSGSGKINFTVHNNQSVKVTSHIEEFDIQLPFKDPASQENLFHCIALLLLFGITPQDIQYRTKHLLPVAMRLQLKQARYNSYVVDDTYNTDLEGLKIALQFLNQHPLKPNKVAILSDILQSGLPAGQLYSQVAQALASAGIDHVIAVGTEIVKHRLLFPDRTSFYTDTLSLCKNLQHEPLSDSVILVKGARNFSFETIISALALKIHGTTLEINLNALIHNLNYYKSKLKPTTRIMAMVKSLAYGSGSYEIASVLQYHKVDYLAVAYTDEGTSLRENGISQPIMVMNPTIDAFSKILEQRLEPEIYSLELLHAFGEYVKTAKARATIHLALDTGMHRLGLEEGRIDALCSALSDYSFLQVASIFTHLVGSDDCSLDRYTHYQIDSFRAMADKISGILGYTPLYHVLNTAGVSRFPAFQMDMVRLGIGLYGIDSALGDEPILQTVGTLKTIISQIREVEAGDTIGYNRKGIVDKKSTIATLAIGYADGYRRSFSNGVGYAFLHGKMAPIIGNICMDMCMINISGIDANVGDEVILFGKEIPVTILAKNTGTIPYEILTNISERVKRVFYLD